MAERKIKLPRPWIEARLSVDAGGGAASRGRIAEAEFYSGAEVLQFSWERGEYKLTLDTSPGAVRMGRLAGGAAPVLDAHNQFSNDSVIGVVESASFQDGRGVAVLRFAEGDAAADRVWNKIAQGVLRNVSVGLNIYAMRETTEKDAKVRSFTAVDWEPLEISVVPVGADPGARIRMAATMAEEIEVTLAGDAQPVTAEETVMQKETADVTASAQNAERKRQAEIREKARPFAARLGEAFIDDLAASDVTPEQAGLRILERLAASGGGEEIRSARASVTVDEREKMREAMSLALHHRADPSREAPDGAREFCAMSLLEMAKHCLRAGRAPGVDRMDRARIASAALGLETAAFAGAHSTGDFPYILANVANKTLLSGYAYANPTYRAWTRMTTAPDFKTISRVRLGEFPSLPKVKEGGVIEFGTMSESREQYALATYGRRFAVTRQALINDDLSAFQQLLPQAGAQVARLENRTVYAVLTANAAMGDGVALFHAQHGNLAGAGSAISITSLSAGRATMKKQTGVDGETLLNITPRFLIVPAQQQTVAQQHTDATGILVNTQASMNPFAGALTVIADAEIDSASGTAWYLAADPIMGTVEYCFLEGNAGPRMESRTGFEVEGIEFKVAHDFAAKAVDWRGLYKNPGA
jgi:phage head maturation protease/phage major head subunit gpT-like protein